MFAGGILIAAMALGGEYYTAVIDYPYNVGGRPLNSWPAVMLVPFATGILGATIAGFNIRFSRSRPACRGSTFHCLRSKERSAPARIGSSSPSRRRKRKTKGVVP